jgi:hypothetical protein
MSRTPHTTPTITGTSSAGEFEVEFAVGDAVVELYVEW